MIDNELSILIIKWINNLISYYFLCIDQIKELVIIEFEQHKDIKNCLQFNYALKNSNNSLKSHIYDISYENSSIHDNKNLFSNENLNNLLSKVMSSERIQLKIKIIFLLEIINESILTKLNKSLLKTNNYKYNKTTRDSAEYNNKKNEFNFNCSINSDKYCNIKDSNIDYKNNNYHNNQEYIKDKLNNKIKYYIASKYEIISVINNIDKSMYTTLILDLYQDYKSKGLLPYPCNLLEIEIPIFFGDYNDTNSNSINNNSLNILNYLYNVKQKGYKIEYYKIYRATTLQDLLENIFENSILFSGVVEKKAYYLNIYYFKRYKKQLIYSEEYILDILQGLEEQLMFKTYNKLLYYKKNKTNSSDIKKNTVNNFINYLMNSSDIIKLEDFINTSYLSYIESSNIYNIFNYLGFVIERRIITPLLLFGKLESMQTIEIDMLFNQKKNEFYIQDKVIYNMQYNDIINYISLIFNICFTKEAQHLYLNKNNIFSNENKSFDNKLFKSKSQEIITNKLSNLKKKNCYLKNTFEALLKKPAIKRAKVLNNQENIRVNKNYKELDKILLKKNNDNKYIINDNSILLSDNKINDILLKKQYSFSNFSYNELNYICKPNFNKLHNRYSNKAKYIDLSKRVDFCLKSIIPKSKSRLFLENDKIVKDIKNQIIILKENNLSNYDMKILFLSKYRSNEVLFHNTTIAIKVKSSIYLPNTFLIYFDYLCCNILEGDIIIYKIKLEDIVNFNYNKSNIVDIMFCLNNNKDYNECFYNKTKINNNNVYTGLKQSSISFKIKNSRNFIENLVSYIQLSIIIFNPINSIITKRYFEIAGAEKLIYNNEYSKNKLLFSKNLNYEFNFEKFGFVYNFLSPMFGIIHSFYEDVFINPYINENLISYISKNLTDKNNNNESKNMSISPLLNKISNYNNYLNNNANYEDMLNYKSDADISLDTTMNCINIDLDKKSNDNHDIKNFFDVNYNNSDTKLNHYISSVLKVDILGIEDIENELKNANLKNFSEYIIKEYNYNITKSLNINKSANNSINNQNKINFNVKTNKNINFVNNIFKNNINFQESPIKNKSELLKLLLNLDDNETKNFNSKYKNKSKSFNLKTNYEALMPTYTFNDNINNKLKCSIVSCNNLKQEDSMLLKINSNNSIIIENIEKTIDNFKNSKNINIDNNTISNINIDIDIADDNSYIETEFFKDDLSVKSKLVNNQLSKKSLLCHNSKSSSFISKAIKDKNNVIFFKINSYESKININGDTNINCLNKNIVSRNKNETLNNNDNSILINNSINSQPKNLIFETFKDYNNNEN